jgi:hypothetical protein
MDKFVRTINSSDAYRARMAQLQNEFDRKNKEKRSLSTYVEMGKSGGRVVGGAVLERIAGLFYLIMIIAIIVIVISAIYAYSTDNTNGMFESISPGILVMLITMILGRFFKEKAERLFKKAQDSYDEMMKKIDKYNEELCAIEDEMANQKAIFEQHMFNQQEIINQEVIAQYTNQTSSEMNDTKECPRCAESIKAKAKVCRYCNYKLEDIINA